MNVDRLLREAESRLADFPEDLRSPVLDALREEIARERRRTDPGPTVEAERERRIEAETLREVLEAINRQARLEETIDEVLKQLARIVAFDSCALALLDPQGLFRTLAVRGFPRPQAVIGRAFRDPLAEAVRESRWPLSLADVESEPRFVKMDDAVPVRSWVGIPLLVEGEVVGVLSLHRHRVESFDDEDLHRARAFAFSAAVAIRKAHLLEQVRRYAALMERVVTVDQAVFEGRSAPEVARTILEGGLRIGGYPAGLLILRGSTGTLEVVATTGEAFEGIEGRHAPEALWSLTARRVEASRASEVAEALGVPVPSQEIYLVPLATPSEHVGTLAFIDPNGESAEDRLMEAYASRAATAYLHAVRAGRFTPS